MCDEFFGTDIRAELEKKCLLKEWENSNLLLTFSDFYCENWASIFENCKFIKAKDQTISEWIYEVIVFPKIWTKNCQDFCPL